MTSSPIWNAKDPDYFVKAAGSLSFSEAAKIANVAQSTLSQQIRQLEDELGVRLFERSTHAIRLTEAGREVLPAAQRTLHDADQCADRIRDLRNLHTGQLNIGVTYSFSPSKSRRAAVRKWCRYKYRC